MLIQFPLIMALYNIIRNPLTYISGMSSDSVNKLVDIYRKFYELGEKAQVSELAINNALLKDSAFLEKAGELVDKGEFELINMNFMWILDLGENPVWNPKTIMANLSLYLPLLLIPVLSLASAILLQRLSMARTKKLKKDDKKEGFNMANSMMLMMPLFSFFIAFSVPAGLGLYWTISNVLSIAQMALINRILAKQKEGRL